MFCSTDRITLDSDTNVTSTKKLLQQVINEMFLDTLYIKEDQSNKILQREWSFSLL